METKFSVNLTFATYVGRERTFRISQVRPFTSTPSILFEEIIPFHQFAQRISSYDPKTDPMDYVAKDMAEWISVELGTSNHTKEVARKQNAEILSQISDTLEFVWKKFNL